MEGHPPSTQPPVAGTACPAAARPAATTGHVRQCGSGQDDGQRYPTRRFILVPPENHRDHHHPPPRSRATTATRATNVRARTSAATSSTSPSPSTSAPPTPVAAPHQQHATSTTRTTGDRAPSRAGTPQSPRQERASKRAAQRQSTQHHTTTGDRGHRASPAGSGTTPSPTNTGAVGTQPEQPSGTAHSHREPAQSPTGSPQPLSPPVTPAHGPRLAASQAAATQAHPEPRPHHGTPDRPAADPAQTPPDGPPTQAHTATPTDTTAARPSGTVHPHTPGPTEGLTPQAPVTSGTGGLPAMTRDGPAPHQPGRRRDRQSRHLPVAQPPARAPAWIRHAPPPRRAPHSPRARGADPSHCSWRKTTPGGHRNRQTMKPSRLHRRPNRSGRSPRWARKQCGGPPQRTSTPTQMGEPGGGAGRPSMQSTDPPHEAARGSDEALAAGQPDAEPKGPTQDTECEDGLHRPSAADRASAAPLANLALRADASTPEGAPQRDPSETRAGSETREATPDTPQRTAEGGTSPDGHNRDNDSFDAFMESCRDDPHAVPAPAAPRVHPEPRRDQAEDTPLTASRQAHLQRDYTALGQVTTEGEGQATANARRTGPRTSAAPQERVRAWKRPPTPLASLSARRRGPPRPGGGGIWTTHPWKATPATPANKRSKRQPKTWASGSPGLSQESSSPWLSAYDGCFPCGPATSQREPAPWRTSRLANGRGTRPPPPWTTPANGYMWPPGSWRIWGPTARMK